MSRSSILVSLQGEGARLLGKMLGDPMLRENRRAACRAFVDSLSWEGPLDQTEELYRRCVGR